MFKLFRQYNKYILAIGVSLLMVVFLIEGALSGRQAKPGDETIGTLNGRSVTGRDLQNAQGQLGMLGAINNSLPMLASPDPLTWMLMVEEAKSLGISASEVEVDALLKAVGLEDDAKLMERVKPYSVPMATARAAVRDWIAVQNYRELTLGRVHSGIESKLQGIQFAGYMMQMGNYGAVGMMMEMARGLPRVSEPVMARYLQDESATVRISAVKIGVEKYLPKAGAPDDKLIAELYGKYKDVLPRREGETPAKSKDGKDDENTHGFGYRIPDLAKLEYLAIPLDRIAKTIDIDEADLLSYYDTNKAQFIPTPPPADPDPKAPKPAPLPPQPYEAVRSQIERTLRDRRAWETGEKMMAAATTQLAASLKDFREEAGYKNVPADFKGTPLSVVAEALQKQFGVLPDVERIEDRWLDRAGVEQLPGFGRSVQSSNQGQLLTLDYVFSAREFWINADAKSDAKTDAKSVVKTASDAARRLHLQVGAPSVPMVGETGTRYLFRVTAAQPSRLPKDLDEVRAKVTADVTKLQAYHLLKADSESLIKQMLEGGPAVVAKAFDTERLSPPEFPRRQSNQQTGELALPYVLGIGRDEKFVDGVFALVDKAGGPALNGLAAEKRVGTVALDSSFSLVLIRLEEYKPLTKSQFEAKSRGGFAAAQAATQLMSGTEQTDPFTVEALSKRVKYVPKHGKDDEKDDKAKDSNGDKKPAASTEKG